VICLNERPFQLLGDLENKQELLCVHTAQGVDPLIVAFTCKYLGSVSESVDILRFDFQVFKDQVSEHLFHPTRGDPTPEGFLVNRCDLGRCHLVELFVQRLEAIKSCLEGRHLRLGARRVRADLVLAHVTSDDLVRHVLKRHSSLGCLVFLLPE